MKEGESGTTIWEKIESVESTATLFRLMYFIITGKKYPNSIVSRDDAKRIYKELLLMGGNIADDNNGAFDSRFSNMLLEINTRKNYREIARAWIGGIVSPYIKRIRSDIDIPLLFEGSLDSADLYNNFTESFNKIIPLGRIRFIESLVTYINEQTKFTTSKVIIRKRHALVNNSKRLISSIEIGDNIDCTDFFNTLVDLYHIFKTTNVNHNNGISRRKARREEIYRQFDELKLDKKIVNKVSDLILNGTFELDYIKKFIQELINKDFDNKDIKN